MLFIYCIENFPLEEMRYLVRTYYDGKNYYGYQRQPGLLTVEGKIINALIETGHIDTAEENQFRSASRTDRHVSAIGNVFAFDSNKEIIINQINAKCPKDKSIICWSFGEADKGFSPKYSKWKKYWYILPYSYVEKTTDLTIDEIKTLCSIFVGEHDYRLFCKIDHRDTNRNIYEINIKKKTDELIFEFIAPSFLWEQVRRIVAYILKYKKLSKELQKTEELLIPQSKISSLNMMPASPNSLMLVEHHYENITWYKCNKSVLTIKKKIKDHLTKLKQEALLNSAIHDFFETCD